MTEPRSDKTAILAALGRARHLRDDPPPPILADVLAAPLCGPDVDAMIDEAIPIIGRSLTFVVRARYTEDRLKAARARGIGQYVILGAGLDTFAYRHRDHL